MKIIHHAKKVKNIIQNGYGKLTAMVILAFVSTNGWADSNGVIPISTDDQTGNGSNADFAQTMMSIFKKDVIPFIEIAGGVWIVWTAISTMANGVKEAQEKQKFDPLKNAIIKTAIVVVVGGALIYLLDVIRAKTFS